MPRTTAEPKGEMVSFRIPAALKDEFAEIAEREAKPLGELLRELIRERIERERRRAFEAEVRRQCREAAEAATDSNSDEVQVMRELEDRFVDVLRDWKYEWK